MCTIGLLLCSKPIKKIDTLHHEASHPCHTQNSSSLLILILSRRTWTSYPSVVPALKLSFPPFFGSLSQSISSWYLIAAQINSGTAESKRTHGYQYWVFSSIATSVLSLKQHMQQKIRPYRETSLWSSSPIFRQLKWQILLCQWLSFHKWDIIQSEYLQKLILIYFISLCMWKFLGHKLPTILCSTSKKVHHKLHFLVLGTRTRVETSLHIRYPSQSDNRVLVSSKLRRFRTIEISIQYRPTSLKSCSGDNYSDCGSSNLRDGGIAPVNILNQCSLVDPKISLITSWIVMATSTTMIPRISSSLGLVLSVFQCLILNL